MNMPGSTKITLARGALVNFTREIVAFNAPSPSESAASQLEGSCEPVTKDPRVQQESQQSNNQMDLQGFGLLWMSDEAQLSCYVMQLCRDRACILCCSKGGARSLHVHRT